MYMIRGGEVKNLIRPDGYMGVMPWALHIFTDLVGYQPISNSATHVMFFTLSSLCIEPVNA